MKFATQQSLETSNCLITSIYTVNFIVLKIVQIICITHCSFFVHLSMKFINGTNTNQLAAQMSLALSIFYKW